MHASELAADEASEREYAQETIFILMTYQPHSDLSPILRADGVAIEGQARHLHPDISAILEEESKVPWLGLSRCAALSVLVLICSLFKGGEHTSVIGVYCGDPMCECHLLSFFCCFELSQLSADTGFYSLFRSFSSPLPWRGKDITCATSMSRRFNFITHFKKEISCGMVAMSFRKLAASV